MEDMNDNVKKLYDTLSKDGYDTGKFDSFASKIQQPGNLRKLYDVLAADNYDVGEFEGFSNKLFSSPALDLPDTITMPAESTFVNNPIPAAPIDKNALPRFGDTEGLLSYNQEQVNEEHAKKEAFEKQLDEAIQDNAKKKETGYKKPGLGSYVLDAATWMTSPVLGAESMVANYYMNQPESYRDRRTAGKLLEDAKNMKEMSQAEKEQGDWRRFFSSFGRTIKDEDTLTLGFTEIDNNVRLIDVSKKYEKVGFDNLTPSEQELLQAATIKAAAEAYYAHDIGIAQKAGQSTAASIPYMLQFLATSGIGSAASAGVRKALMSTAKHMLKKGVNKELLKIGTSLASNAAKAAAMTPFQPAMYEDITSRLAGNASVVPDEDGRVQFVGMENQAGLGEAIVKGFGSTAIENFSEMSGEYLGGVGRLASKYGKKIPKVGGLIDKAEKNQLLTGFNKFSKDLGWHGTMEEFFEEQVGTGLNALLIGDSKFSDMVDGQQQLATLLSVAAMGGAFVAGNSAVGAPMKRKIRQEYDNAKSLAQDLFGAEEFDKFRMSLSNLPIERRPEFIKKVADVKGFTNEQLMSLGAYAVIQSRYEGYVGGIRDKINEEVVKAQDDMKKVSNPVMGAFVTVTSPLSDKPVNIVGGYLAFTEDGFVDAKNSSQTIYYLDKDGKRQMASPDKFEELSQMVPLEEMYARAMTDVTERIVSEEESLLNSQPFKPNDIVTTPDGFSGMVTEVKADEGIAVVKGQDGAYRDIPLDKLELKQTQGEENTNIPPSEPVDAQQPPADTQQTDASSQPAAEAPKPNFPLTKSGDVDYDRITDPQMYADALVANFGEEALDTVNELISEENARLEKAQKKANAIDRRLTMKKIKAEIERLGKVRQILSPAEETVTPATEEGVVPKQEAVSGTPVPHESLNDREYAEWALEESENSDELLDAYEIAKESGGERNKLLPWQKELLGKKINPESFYRFGDRNKVNGLFARAWLKKDGYRIDTYADELSELGVEVTLEDIVDFMLSNPTNYVRKTSDLQKALGKRWAEVATNEAGVPIGNPESATGKVFIAMKKKGGIVSPVVYEEAVQADYFREDEKMVEDLSGKPVEKNQEDKIQNDEEAAWTPEDYQEIYEAIDKELNVSENEKEGTGFEASDTRAIDPETGREVGTGGDPDGKADYAGEDRTSAGRDSEAGFAPNGRLEADGNVAGVVPEPSVVAGRETPLETIERVAAEQNKRDAVASAEKEVDVHPTEAQKEAGNYKKGHVKVNGFDITIEQPAGSVRSGKDASGKEWSVKMNNTYGYFKGTKGKDGDHIDVFLGSKLGSGKVFVVDQVNPDGSFDEHKVMMGFDSVDEAKTAYLSNYEEGWQGLGNITEVPLDKFKKWVDSSHRKTKPFSEYKSMEEVRHSASTNKTSDEITIRFYDGQTISGNIIDRSGGKVKVKASNKKIYTVPENRILSRGKEAGITEGEDTGVRFRKSTTVSEEESLIERSKANGTYMKAPNGKPTNLNEKQWIQVRSKAFKEWFGDWEKAARIEKLRKSKSVEITGDEITPSDDMKQYKKNALEYGKTLRGEYVNKDTGSKVSVSSQALKEVLRHDGGNVAQVQSVAAIPAIIEDAVYVDTVKNEDTGKNPKVKEYQYYVAGLKIGDEDYTVKSVVAVDRDGNRYYDHALTQIEKGNLLNEVDRITSPSRQEVSSLSLFKDKRLLSILQTNSSKVVDENGEPLVVYHGTNNYEESRKWNNETRTYDKEYTPFTVFKTQYDEQTGHFFNSDKSNAEGYGFTLYETFINLKKPLVIDAKGFPYSQIAYNGETKDTYEWTEYAKKNGYDGVIFRNVRDGVDYSDMQFSTDEYVALKSNQIKSATENNGDFSIYSNDIRYRKAESESSTNQDGKEKVALSAVNERFNEELQQQIEGTLPKGHVYALGKPGVALLSAGIPDLPIELAASRLEGKSRQENHPFELSEIKNLPEAIQNPLAVFRSATHIGSFVVMTEIEHKGKNFVVAIEANRKRGKIEVNSIRSVHYRTTNAHMANWINEGLLEYVDKQRMSVWLSKQRYNSADVRQLYGHATKIVNSFDNPTFTEGKKIAEVKNLSSELNTPVRIVRDVNDLPGDVRKRRAKGYYDPKTGETVIVLPNNTDVADVQKTLLHEIVAHKGLRGLLGDKLDDMLDRIFAGLPEKQRAALAREAYSEYEGNVRVATEEYLARIAEKDIQPTVWEKVKSAIRDFFRSLGIELRMADADIQYLLWKSKNRLKRDGSMLEIVENVARDADMKERLYREDKPGKEKEPLVSPEQLAQENPIDQARIVNEALELSEEEKNDFSKKIKHDRLREGWQDRFIPVLRFQELIAKKFGRPIKDFCNAYIFENTIASRSTYEIERYKQMYLRPLLDIVARLGGQDKVADYMKAKHGLERNEVMRARAIERRRAKLESRYEALKESLKNKLSELENQNGVSQAKINSYTDSVREALQKEKERMEESMAKYEQRQAGTDYSGLTGLQQKLSGEKTALNEGYIRDFVDAFEKDHNVKPLWDAIRKSTRFSLEKQYLSGCIDKKTLDHISGMYEYYIPLREWEEDTAEDFYDYFFKEGKDTLIDPLKKTKGRKSEAGDPFANIASMASSAIFIGNKNLMKQHFLRLVTNYKTNLATVSDSWYIYEKDVDGSGVPGWREVRPEFREDMTEEEQQEVVEEFNARMKELQQDGLARTELSGLDLGVPIKPYQAEQHVIKVKENGVDKLIFIQGNPRVAQAINGLNNVRAYDSRLLKAMSNIKQFMTQNFTTRNPTFVARNLSRDMIYAVTMHGIREGGAYTTEFLKAIPGASGAIARYLRGKADMSNEMDKMFEEFLRNGGETGFVALTSYETYKKEIRRMVNKAARTNAVADSWEAIGKAFEGCNRWAEDLSRFATYVASRKVGRSVMRSVSDAKEVTVNFNRKGSGAYGGWIGNLCYFFLNAGMQGMHNFGKTFKAHPVKTTFAMTAWAMLGALMPDLISLLYGDDEDYNNIPDHVRQNSIVIPMGGRYYFAVPLSIEVRAFYGIGDIIRQIVKGNYNDRATDAASDIMERLMDLTPRNFIGNSDDGGKGVIGAIASNAVPDVLKPFVEAYVTNSDFAGRPIVKDTEYNKYEPEYQRVYKGTAKELLASSEFINRLSGGDYATKGWADSPWLNPAAVEHLFESYFGGVGKTIMQTKKTIASPWTEDFALRNVPVVSGFTYELNPTYPNTAINERYQVYTDLIKEMQSRERMYDKGMMAGEPLDKNYKAFMNSRDWKVAEIAQSYKELIDGIGKEANLAKDKKDKERLYAEITGLKKKMLEQIDNVK